MKKSVFIITEDLDNGVIQSQVLTQIKFLRHNRICESKIVICYWDEKKVQVSRRLSLKFEKIYNTKIVFLKLISPKFIFSDYVNSKKLCSFFLKLDFKIDYIHARTDLCAIISLHLKKETKAKLIWDCRGYAPAEIDYQEKIIFNYFKKKYLKHRFNNACRISDKVIVVSSFLKSLVQRIKKENIFIIPSAASSSLFFFDRNKRFSTRKKLKIKNKDTVFVFSGSLKKYQMFDETINLFNSILKKKSSVILLVLTKDIIQAKNKVHNLRNIKVLSIEHNEVNNFLNASDFAIMIRKNDETNKAASPTKFAEYCLTGLDVITNNSVIDYYDMKKKINNIHDLDSKSFSIDSLKKSDRRKTALFYKSKVSKESFINTYKKLYE